MKVIFSDSTYTNSSCTLRFELLNTKEQIECDNFKLVFKEKNTQCIYSIPFEHVENNIITTSIVPIELITSLSKDSKFIWQMQLFHISKNKMLAIENNHVNNKFLVADDGTIFSFLTTQNKQATILIQNTSDEEKYNISTLQLMPDSLYLSGINHYNHSLMRNLTLILSARHNNFEQRFPIQIENDLFDISLPYSAITKQGKYKLSLSFELVNESGHTAEFHQQVVHFGANVETDERVKVAKKTYLSLSIHSDGNIFIQKYKTASLGKQLKLKSTENITQFKIRNEKSLRQRRLMIAKKILKQTHTPFTFKTIVFESFGGRQVSDSPMAIYKLMQRYYPSFQLIWSIDKSQVDYCITNDINYVIRETKKWAQTMAQAHVWISNARIPLWVKKQKHTLYIQTWHGTPLKKLGLDIKTVTMPGTTTKKYHRNFVKEASRWNALVSPNDYSTAIFRKAFGFKNKILKVGYPRNDKLLNSTTSEIEEIKATLNIPAEKKVILYAPTYRDNQFVEQGKYTFELPFNLKALRDKFGEECVLVLRMHYLISNALDLSGFDDFVIDASMHPDISDLYLTSDMLITDYSSVFFDYAYLKKPLLFYPYDFNIYKDELRGFYLDYEKMMPGNIYQNERELVAGISELVKTENCEPHIKSNDFHQEFCAINDGRSSLRVIEYIINNLT